MDISAQITNIITNSNDPEELKNKIVKEVAIILNAAQCFFIEYDLSTNNFKEITNLYSQKRESLSLLGYDFENNLKYIAVKLKYMKSFVIEDTDEFIKNNKLENKKEYQYFKDFEVKSFLAVRLEFGETFSGILAINYDKKRKNLQETDLQLLKDIAEHVSIALHLSILYTEEKNKKEREKLLSSMVSIMGEDYELERINQKIFTILGQVFNAQSIFMDINAEDLKRFYFYNFSKYKSNDFSEYEKNDLFNVYDRFYFDAIKSKVHYIANTHHFIISNNLENTSIEKYFEENNIKSVILLPIFHETVHYGLLIIHFEIINPVDKETLELIKTITTQLGIVVKQVQLYEKTKKQAERESLLRNITEKIRSSLDIEETLFFICHETAKLFNVQRTTITTFPNPENYENFTIRKEYKTTNEIEGFGIGEELSKISVYWAKNLIAKGEILAIDNIETAEVPDYFQHTYKLMNVKSLLGTSIRKGNDVWGILVLSEHNYIRHWTEEEKMLLKTIADQVYIAINQAELYEKEKQALERERISRNIIEILRSSIDKIIIKKLFVKNIGKFFNADRVFVAEYDSINKSLQPVDENSEYLSNIDEKSFIGFDWTGPDTSLCVQPLLEKREIKIPDWQEFITNTQNIPNNFLTMYELTQNKSSYAFPIMYQNNLMGFFCIEFTKNVSKLTDEDISIIRSICTQAGIALYHAKLYEEATECFQSKKTFINNVYEKITKPTNEILDVSMLISKNDFERPKEIEYLNKIINSCNQLLEITKQ